MLILLTGPPGIGKTTVARRIAESVGFGRVAGFFSSEVRVDGRRQGFQVTTLDDGQSGLLAAPHLPGEPRFGSVMPDGRKRLGLDTGFLDAVACPSLLRERSRASLLLIDEIGPMQAASYTFRSMVDLLLQDQEGPPLLATIAESSGVEWVEALRERSGGALLPLNRSNRDLLGEALSAWLSRGQ